jgi:5-hydroxyisourate hydrolase
MITMSSITTHILDTARGLPAEGVAVRLDHLLAASDWETIGAGTTNSDGRLTTLLSPDSPLTPGTYRLTFDTDAYFQDGGGPPAFYPEVQITFAVTGQAQHLHLPLLLSPFGYSTYRGS